MTARAAAVLQDPRGVENVLPPAPTEFEPGWHALRLRTVELQPDPGVRRYGCRLRLVFDAHQLDTGGAPGRLIDRFDVFEHIAGELASAGEPFLVLLRHLGVDPDEARPDQIASRLVSHWVRGYIGPRDPAAAGVATADPTRGYQPLLDSEPMQARRPEDHPTGPPTCGSVPCPGCPNSPRPRGGAPREGHPAGDERPSGVDAAELPIVPFKDKGAVRPTAPVLVLRTLRGRGPNNVHVARLVGGLHEEVDMSLGRRQLFFLHLLFTSTRVDHQDGIPWTVVSEDEARRAFLEWVGRGFLRCIGEDQEYPEGRLAKNWNHLVARFSKEPGLQGLLEAFPRTGKAQKRFAIRLVGEDMRVELPAIHQLLDTPDRRT